MSAATATSPTTTMQSASFAPPTVVRVECPAKTNLTLNVGAPKEEWGGRHRLDTIYCAVGIYDTVTLTQKAPGSGFSLDISGAHLGDLAHSQTDMRRNHAVQALFAMSQAAERSTDVGINLLKRIPVGAGLGGGSSDAAGTILGLNTLWNLHWPLERLQEIAATLGADMPFCLSGGLARGTEYGQRIEVLKPPYDGVDGTLLGRMVVGAYNTQLSTPQVYRTFDQIGSDRSHANKLQKAAVYLLPRSGEAIEYALNAGATAAFVSGSGPSVVACAPDAATAASISQLWTTRRCVDRLFETTAPVTPSVTIL